MASVRRLERRAQGISLWPSMAPERTPLDPTLLPAITGRCVDVVLRPPKLPLRRIVTRRDHMASSPSYRRFNGSPRLAAVAMMGAGSGGGGTRDNGDNRSGSAHPDELPSSPTSIKGTPRSSNSHGSASKRLGSSPCLQSSDGAGAETDHTSQVASGLSPPWRSSPCLVSVAEAGGSTDAVTIAIARPAPPRHALVAATRASHRSFCLEPGRVRKGTGRKKRALSSSAKGDGVDSAPRSAISARKSSQQAVVSRSRTQGARSPPGPKFLYVAQFGNNSPLIRQVMRLRPGWASGPGDPGNLMGKTSYNEKRVEVPLTDDLPEVHFLWTQYRQGAFLDSMVTHQPGLCITLNEETRIQMKQKCIKPDMLPAPVARVHNHFEGNGGLCTKRGLRDSIVQFYLKRGRDPFGAVPMTFVIRNGSFDAQFAEWRRAYDAIESDSGQRLWLVKPGEWANRGCGIRIYDNADDVMKRVDSKAKCWVVQKYMERPLLLHRRKFDIRSYGLVSQESGGLSAFFYRQAYLRTTSAEYTTKTLDRMVHLNNDAVQKKGEDYGKFESANKLSLEDLQKYLDEHHPKDCVSVQERIVPQMRGLMADAVRSVADSLNPRQIDHCFEVLGFDFMVDAGYRVWLIEVNTNPCLELCCPFLSQLIPKMLDEALQITLDRVFPSAAAANVTQRPTARRAADVVASTGWELLWNSSDPADSDICSTWLPKVPPSVDVDVPVMLGRDVLAAPKF